MGDALKWLQQSGREGVSQWWSMNILSRFSSLSLIMLPSGGRLVNECWLQQGNHHAAEYALEFRSLATESGWNESALKLVFHQGLKTNVRTEMGFPWWQSYLPLFNWPHHTSTSMEISSERERSDFAPNPSFSAPAMCIQSPSCSWSRTHNHNPIILCATWLQQYDPHISWNSREIKNSPNTVTQTVWNNQSSVSYLQLLNLLRLKWKCPYEYKDFEDVFS